MDPINNQPTKFNFHKVFAALGIILTVVILLAAGLWIYIQNQDKSPSTEEEGAIKVSTSSAPKTSTETATKSAE